MPAYPGLERDKRVPFDVLLEFVADIFVHCGMRPGDASLLAGTLAAADVRGVHSHGTIRVPEYVRKLSKGGVDPKGKPRVVSERAAAIVVDGGNSMGQIGAMFAMERIIERARDLNVGTFREGKFLLSHFSGARPALLEIVPQQNGTLDLTFKSARGVTKLSAIRPAEARAKGLPEPTDPALHTRVKDPNEPFRFTFPDLKWPARLEYRSQVQEQSSDREHHRKLVPELPR
jgi:hypothetical protein